MNGAHDLGGQMGFGPVAAPATEPVFHEEWEARMAALMMAVGDVGGWNIDQDRSACESMHPAKYLSTTYYEHWLHGLEYLLTKYTPKADPTRPQDIWAAITARGSYIREAPHAAAFAAGQKIRVKIMNPETHTRAPRYVRGHVGEIIRVNGAHVFPDSNALGLGENPQWLYTVRFTAGELWGNTASDAVHADLWEPYLEPAT
jgi:nitrile hydratase subunit beta